MQQQSFKVQESTVRFFYEVDLYWKDHGKEKTELSKKLKPLYKGLSGRILGPSREAFLYRNPSKLLSYKVVRNMVPPEVFVESVLKESGFFKEYYNVFCNYYFKNLKADDIKAIHETYKDHEFSLAKDTYLCCL